MTAPMHPDKESEKVVNTLGSRKTKDELNKKKGGGGEDEHDTNLNPRVVSPSKYQELDELFKSARSRSYYRTLRLSFVTTRDFP